jgi:hypothetical protein
VWYVFTLRRTATSSCLNKRLKICIHRHTHIKFLISILIISIFAVVHGEGCRRNAQTTRRVLCAHSHRGLNILGSFGVLHERKAASNLFIRCIMANSRPAVCSPENDVIAEVDDLCLHVRFALNARSSRSAPAPFDTNSTLSKINSRSLLLLI